jgi:hypothetical protein
MRRSALTLAFCLQPEPSSAPHRRPRSDKPEFPHLGPDGRNLWFLCSSRSSGEARRIDRRRPAPFHCCALAPRYCRGDTNWRRGPRRRRLAPGRRPRTTVNSRCITMNDDQSRTVSREQTIQDLHRKFTTSPAPIASDQDTHVQIIGKWGSQVQSAELAATRRSGAPIAPPGQSSATCSVVSQLASHTLEMIRVCDRGDGFGVWTIGQD